MEFAGLNPIQWLINTSNQSTDSTFYAAIMFDSKQMLTIKKAASLIGKAAFFE
jgi:hypothetical protein